MPYAMTCKICNKNWSSPNKEVVCECGAAKVAFTFVSSILEVTDTVDVTDTVTEEE